MLTAAEAAGAVKEAMEKDQYAEKRGTDRKETH
jgi:hypothetical protein